MAKLNRDNYKTQKRVEVLYNDITNSTTVFKNYTGFLEWLSSITDIELEQLSIKIDIFQSFKKMERSNYEKIIRKNIVIKMVETIKIQSQFIDNPILENEEIENENIEQLRIDKRMQIVYKMYSLFFNMIDLFRKESDEKHNYQNLRFKKTLESVIGVCDRLEKQMVKIKPPYCIRRIELQVNILKIFENIKDYSNKYDEEIVEYNVKRKITLLLCKKMSGDIFRIIVSFVSSDPPPLL